MKQINIKANLDESEFRKKLKDIESGKYDVNINVNSKNTVQDLNNISNSAKNTTTIFGRLKNAVSGTFSSRKIETTAYLALLKEINDAAERAKDTMVQLDKVVTDLSVATGDSRSSVKDLLKDYNSMAKQLASTTIQVSQAADDYLRAGKSMKKSNQLIKDSIMLSKLGQINSSEATEDLLATMNGFDMSVNQVNDALDAPLLKNIMYNYLLIKYYTDITVFDNEDNINIDEVEVFIKANGTLIDSINVHPDIEDACKEALEYRINHYNNESVVADFFTALTNAINKFADRDSIDFDTVNRLIDVLPAVKDMDNKEVAKAIVKEFHNDNKGLSYDVSKQPQKSNKGRKPKTEFTVEKGEKTE